MKNFGYKKKVWILGPLTVLALVFFSTASFSMNESALMDQLEGLNPYQALALANQWYWEKQPVKSHITTEEVVFQFKSGATKRVRLPEDKVMIAVAPYLSKTHK